MKMPMLIIYIFGIIFLSCNANTWNDTVITNDSEFEVSFKFNHTGEKHLEIGESATFETKAYQRLVSYSPEKRVFFTYLATNDGYTGQFNTRQSWLVKVNNAIGELATLSADGWMDILENINPGIDDDLTGLIFTNTPSFSVVTESGFPAVAVFNRTDTTFFVTIQWSP